MVLLAKALVLSTLILFVLSCDTGIQTLFKHYYLEFGKDVLPGPDDMKIVNVIDPATNLATFGIDFTLTENAPIDVCLGQGFDYDNNPTFDVTGYHCSFNLARVQDEWGVNPGQRFFAGKHFCDTDLYKNSFFWGGNNLFQFQILSEVRGRFMFVPPRIDSLKDMINKDGSPVWTITVVGNEVTATTNAFFSLRAIWGPSYHDKYDTQSTSFKITLKWILSTNVDFNEDQFNQKQILAEVTPSGNLLAGFDLQSSNGYRLETCTVDDDATTIDVKLAFSTDENIAKFRYTSVKVLPLYRGDVVSKCDLIQCSLEKGGSCVPKGPVRFKQVVDMSNVPGVNVTTRFDVDARLKQGPSDNPFLVDTPVITSEYSLAGILFTTRQSTMAFEAVTSSLNITAVSLLPSTGTFVTDDVASDPLGIGFQYFNEAQMILRGYPPGTLGFAFDVDQVKSYAQIWKFSMVITFKQNMNTHYKVVEFTLGDERDGARRTEEMATSCFLVRIGEHSGKDSGASTAQLSWFLLIALSAFVFSALF